MAKPILLSVDDDSDVLRAIERDLRSNYGAAYRVIGSDSPESALDLLKKLKVRNDSVALLLADQRMPHMDGVEFLKEATRLFPDAKRALLTAYADTTAAISAINQPYHLFLHEAVGSPGEHLYPQLDVCSTIVGFIIGLEGSGWGTRWSRRSYELRDFLARNHVPYQWPMLRLQPSPETRRLLEALGEEAASLPVVLFRTVQTLEGVPTGFSSRIANGRRRHTIWRSWRRLTGLAAAVYGASEGLHGDDRA
jgi:thioredoxin reductase (NADPH)